MTLVAAGCGSIGGRGLGATMSCCSDLRQVRCRRDLNQRSEVGMFLFVARASRPCGAEMARDYFRTPWVAIAFFRPVGPTFPLPVAEPPAGKGGSFFSASPGAWRPRQALCRPSGAGVLGKQRVVHETHIVAPASRPCEAKMSRDFFRTRGRNRSLQARRADISIAGGCSNLLG
jgi:hypothetical protein